MEKTHHLENILWWIGSKITPALIGINCLPSNCANAIRFQQNGILKSPQTIDFHFIS